MGEPGASAAAAAPVTSAAARQDAALDRRRLLLVFAGLMVAVLLAALDQAIVATALPTIVGELHGLEHMAWVVTAYLLAATVGLTIYGSSPTCWAASRSSCSRSRCSCSHRPWPAWPNTWGAGASASTPRSAR